MSEIKLRSRVEVRDWLACLQAAVTTPLGPVADLGVIAGDADRFYAELQSRIEVPAENAGRVMIGPPLEFRAGAGDFDIEAGADEEPKP